jgi:hypothetical protein
VVPAVKDADKMSALPALGAKEAARIKVPDDDAFLHEFILDDKLAKLAEVLIEECDELDFINELGFTVIYLWKQKGGNSGGSDILGKCTKLSGLAKYFGKADFVIWLGSDNCRNREGLNFAALMYHELRHVDKDDKDKPKTQGHEFEGFANEGRAVRNLARGREADRPGLPGITLAGR